MDTIIIAEAGISHEGNSQDAYRLAQKAKESGASAVKFQLFTKESRPFSKEYIIPTKDWKDIFKEFNSESFKVFFSVFDFESLEQAERIGAEWIKLSFISKQNSRLINRVNEVEQFTKKIISVDLYGQYNKEELETWDKLYCPNTGWKASYPTPINEVDFRRFGDLNLFSKGKGRLGFSCHSTDYRNCLIAASLKAPILEKHFRLEFDYASPDSNWSLDPKEFKEFVYLIRLLRKQEDKDILVAP